MKILFISYHYWPPHFGGELKIDIERFETLVKRGHSVIVLTSGVPGYPKQEIIERIQVNRSPIIHNSWAGRGFRRLFFPLWAFFRMKQTKFTVLHHGGTGGIGPISQFLGMTLINWGAHQKGVKSVIVHSLADTENVPFSNYGFENRLRNFYLRYIDVIVSVSPSLHSAVKKYFPDSAILLIPAVHDNLFVPLPKLERDQFRKENKLLNGEIVFTFLGSLGKRKGFDLLTDSFLALIEQFPNWRLWIIGPKDKSENQNLVDDEIYDLSKPLENHQNLVRFWGRVNDQKYLSKILASSDIFVFPSRKEGFGIAPCLAMAVGIPVIISRIPGVTDVANIEGKTGVYIERNSLEDLKVAMIKMATDNELREAMGKAARERIKKDFGWEKQIDEWESLYSSLLEKK